MEHILQNNTGNVKKKCKQFACAESKACRTAFLFIRGTMPGAAYDALEAALAGAAFLLYGFSW